MSSGTGPFAVGPLGLQEGGTAKFAIKNVTAVTQTIGRVVQLDLALVDADTTSLRFGVLGSGYNHSVLPQAGAAGVTGRMSIFGVVVDAAIVAGDTGKVLLMGKVKALALDSGVGNAWIRGEEAIVTTAGVADFNQVAGRVVARAEQAATSAVEVLTDVWFNGLWPATR